MTNRTHARKYRRIVIALIAFCYGWLSAVTSFQHTDVGSDLLEAKALVAASTRHAVPVTPRLRATTDTGHAVHCAICEWQAAHVSTALPLFAIRSSFIPTPENPDVIAALSVRPVLHASSRAPPTTSLS